MADSVTGGGLHGNDLSKADVSVNIYAWLEAQETGKPVELCCAIGDDTCLLYTSLTARQLEEAETEIQRCMKEMSENGAWAMLAAMAWKDG